VAYFRLYNILWAKEINYTINDTMMLVLEAFRNHRHKIDIQAYTFIKTIRLTLKVM
jgi:hypothetical protein